MFKNIYRDIIRNNNGDILPFVAFILPCILFCIFYALTFGVGAYTKSTLTTVSSSGARMLAVTKDENLVKNTIVEQVDKTLGSRYYEKIKFDPNNDIVTKLTDDGYAYVEVRYHVPVVVPGLFKLIGVNNVNLNGYLDYNSYSIFKKEE